MTPAVVPGSLRESRLRAAAEHAAKGAGEPASLGMRLARLPAEERERILSAITPSQAARLLHDWRTWARPTQLAPEGDDWIVWLILAGRGWGKSRTGAEWIKERVERGEGRTVGLIGPSLGDVWDQMVFGSEDAPGIVRLYDRLPEHYRPTVNRQDRKIYFANGSVARIFTAEEPQIRGPNTQSWWCDELAKWPYLRTAWDNIEMTLRAKGQTPPRVCITTTPRPLDLIKELLDDPDVKFTFGSTFANAANLSKSFIRRMHKRYAGSRLGQQELYGLVLGDNPDALFKASAIEAARREEAPALRRVVVAIDPAIATGRRNDFTGIIVIGIDDAGELWVLADLTGCSFQRDAKGLVLLPQEEPRRHSPNEWGELAIRAYDHFAADAIVGERNRGGDLVESNVGNALYRLRGPLARVPFKEVLATRGKAIRAEPVATLYDQGRVHHVKLLAALEDELTEWNPQLPGPSPNRLDALVWGAYALTSELTTELPADRSADFAGLLNAQQGIAPPAFARASGTGASDDWDRV